MFSAIVGGRGSDSIRSAMTRKKRAEGPMPLDWAGWIIRPTDQKYPSIYDLPNTSGIYAWYSKEGDLLYIGRSVAMNSRLRQHHMGAFGGRMLSYREVPERYLAGVEMAHINTLAPFHNEAREASSLPFWDDMCAAIELAWLDVWPAMNARVAARESAINEQIAARL
jgi:hypothetical protein